jgi:uncharacterized protein involved in oxidation of intracellular sulfur
MATFIKESVMNQRDCHHRQRRPLWQRIPVQCPAPAIALREQGGANLKLFLMSDAVSAALAGQAPAEATTCARCWRSCWLRDQHPPLQDLYRCPWHHGAAAYRGIEIGTLPLLAQWTLAADKVLTF